LKYVIALALVLLGGRQACAADRSGAAWTYEYLFAFWQPRVALEPAILGIAAEPASGNQGSLDVAAEFLLQHLDDEQFSSENARDVLDLLSRTRSGRYRLVMERIRASKRPPVFRDIARSFLAANKSSEAAQYVPGTVDFAALREQHIQQALAVRPTEERARLLASMTKGDSLPKLFALLGPPQHVAAVDVMKFRKLLLYYRGAGRAVFALDENAGWALQAAVADPLAFEMFMPYRVRAAEFGLPDDNSIRMAQLTSKGWPAIRTAIESAYRQPQVPLVFLDGTAELLAKHWPDSRDEVVEDTCAWMLRLLRMKGGARYAPLFAEIKKKSDSLVLKKWVKVPLSRYPDSSGNYVVGTVTLDELAQRFPSPYPGVTYSNGRL
jgi:hypothetical protein